MAQTGKTRVVRVNAFPPARADEKAEGGLERTFEIQEGGQLFCGNERR
jgi:hypothetical protein